MDNERKVTSVQVYEHPDQKKDVVVNGEQYVRVKRPGFNLERMLGLLLQIAGTSAMAAITAQFRGPDDSHLSAEFAEELDLMYKGIGQETVVEEWAEDMAKDMLGL